jgi:diguanylate cyclase (GGDEF)-like protein/PAS domain S-box-containing protein
LLSALHNQRVAKERLTLAMQETDTVGTTAYRAVFEHATDGMLFASADGRITAVNPAACSLLAMTADELRALAYDDLIDHEDPRWQLAVAERDRTGSSFGVARLRRGDGRFVELETNNRRLLDTDGSVRLFTILRDITSRVEIEREMEELSAQLLALSRTDELTGFQNRRGLAVAGSKLLQIADAQSGEVRVLFVDVGNVKELNEEVGYHAGDAALQAVARALAVTFRKVDVLARIGGTVFLAIALNLEADECDSFASRILGHLDAPETADFVGARVEVSFGWTTRPAGARFTLEELVARSDRAMLEARDAHRASFTPDR